MKPFPESNANADAIVRKMHATSIVGLSKNRIEALVREGKFPAPFKLCEGGRASGWLRSTLDNYNAARANAAAAAARQCHQLWVAKEPTQTTPNGSQS